LSSVIPKRDFQSAAVKAGYFASRYRLKSAMT